MDFEGLDTLTGYMLKAGPPLSVAAHLGHRASLAGSFLGHFLG